MTEFTRKRLLPPKLIPHLPTMTPSLINSLELFLFPIPLLTLSIVFSPLPVLSVTSLAIFTSRSRRLIVGLVLLITMDLIWRSELPLVALSFDIR